ncbi:hypothetical protein ACH5RR_023322 [Cinchona calisaya]|uniref:Uncharacterized protein n=1 Tax=Cinchona calisaya TaxID=153742 RepID=A0ABD2ZDS7_9GENT
MLSISSFTAAKISMAFESRQGSSENVPMGKDFYLGDFMLTDNPTKKVVKRIHRVQKNTAAQSNPEEDVAISCGSISAILYPLNTQQEVEEAEKILRRERLLILLFKRVGLLLRLRS